MRLRIEPQPPPDEAAAIEAGLIALFGRTSTVSAKKLRFIDIVNAQRSSHDPYGAVEFIRSNTASWSDVARLEALSKSV